MKGTSAISPRLPAHVRFRDLSSVQTFQILKSNSIEILTHSLMNVVFLERSTRTSSASSRFLVITLIEIQGIQIVSQPKHFSPQPIHPEMNEYGFDYRHGRSIHPQNYCILAQQ